MQSYYDVVDSSAGGFDPSGSAGTGGSAAAAASGSQEKRRLPSTLTPVNCKMLVECTPVTGQPGLYQWKGSTFSQVSLVALVSGQHETGSSMRYTFDDGSGSGGESAVASGTMFFSAEEGEEAALAQRFDYSPTGPTGTPTYVYVAGRLSASHRPDESPQFTLHTIEPLVPPSQNASEADGAHNRITYHILSTIHAFLYKTKGKPAAAQQGAGFPDGFPAAPVSYGGASYGGSAGGHRVQPPNPAAVAMSVLNFIQQHPANQSEMGIHPAALAEEMGMGVVQMEEVLFGLNEQGPIYSTMAGHYKSTS